MCGSDVMLYIPAGFLKYDYASKIHFTNPNQAHTKEHAELSMYANIAQFFSFIIYGTDHIYITDFVRR